MDFPMKISISLLQGNLCPSHLFDIVGLSMATNCDVMHGEIMRSKSAQSRVKKQENGKYAAREHKYLKSCIQKKWRKGSKPETELKMCIGFEGQSLIFFNYRSLCMCGGGWWWQALRKKKVNILVFLYL